MTDKVTEKEYGKIIAKNLKRIAYEAGKTQADIAKDLNIKKGTVSTWFCGTRIPRMDKIDALCNYFNVKRVDIMEDNPPSTRKTDSDKFGEWGDKFNAEHNISIKISEKERNLIVKYRMSDGRGKETIEGVAEMEFQRSRPEFIPVAAHHNSGDFTDEQQAKIQEFIKHVTEDKE